MQIKCVVVDDEHPAIMKMEQYISKVPFLKLLMPFNNALDCLSFLKSNEVDLLFLDIQMDDFTGIDLIKSLHNPPAIILTTAFDRYAVEAFDLSVDDYLLKPITFERFVRAVDKVSNRLFIDRPEQSEIHKSESNIKIDQFIFVKTEHKVQRIDIDDILYIEGMKEYLIVKTKDSRFITLSTFTAMEKNLHEYNFVRVHRSYIVAVEKIDSVEKNRLLIGDKVIPIGGIYKKELFNRINIERL